MTLAFVSPLFTRFFAFGLFVVTKAVLLAVTSDMGNSQADKYNKKALTVRYIHCLQFCIL